MKLPPLQQSQSNLNLGLQMMGKLTLNNREWVGKFAQLQTQHQYPPDHGPKKLKASQFLVDNILKFQFAKEVCGLCMAEKPKSEFENLCKCHHRYCYSCLNSYVMVKVEELVPVKCPQQECKEVMVLTSNVFRYLPDSVKLRYLQNKHKFIINEQDWSNRCQRCLNPSHKGQCKYSLSPAVVQSTFNFRKCPKCQVQIRLTSGKRKVTCQRCKNSLCYMCGVPWTDKHQCKQKDMVRNLQKANGYRGCGCCCDCCEYGCEDTCTGCGDWCCNVCGKCFVEDFCCGILFTCKECSFGCLLWNIIGVPVRILLSTLVIATFAIVFGLFLAVVCLWLCVCMVVGTFCAPCQVIADTPCPYTLLLFLLYPFVAIYGFARTVSETGKVPVEFFCGLLETTCGALADVWVNLSPQKCLY